MSSEKLEDLKLSNDEIKRISDAMKDETFRKLFADYAEEISNPENRRLYEEEITQLESDRGIDVTFVNPTPGHVLKTNVNGETKGFINICQSDKINKPSSQRQKGDNGKSGLMWHIPHSFAPPREDVDKNGLKCQVFDVVFHPDSYRMAQSNLRFKKLVEDTALDGIENQFSVKLDRTNLKRPNMTFKGTPSATVIRSKSEAEPVEPTCEFLKNMAYPYDKNPSVKGSKTPEKPNTVADKNKKNVEIKTSDPAKPKYSILHRSELDIQEYANTHGRPAKTSTRPKELVVTIELPLLKSAASTNLDIFERRLILESKEPAEYKLDLVLPYPVNDEDGSAKFDKIKRSLVITLPVLPDKSLPEENFGAPATEVESHQSESFPIGADNKQPEGKSLIEVLEDPVQTTLEAIVDGECTDSDSVENSKMSASHKITSVIYTRPDFTFTQDLETVNFVINVKNISMESVSKSFPSTNAIVLKFSSVGSGCFPMRYSLHLQFPDGCQFAAEHCSVNIIASTLVLLILKSKTCRSLWDSFQAGVDETDLEDQIFLTESNLQSQLDQFDQQAVEKFNTGGKSVVTVTEMNQKKLTITLQKLSIEEEDDDDTPSSGDIEVIHKFAPPKLHSILKQRTISESSDDYGLSPTSESPRSDEDLAKLNKSVSFNNHVDSASFHSSKCPQSVKITLHNKHKKQKKKENLKRRRQERQRHNSTGSECSSGDDISDGQSQSDTSLANEDFEKIKEECEDVSEEVAKLAHAISKGFAESPPSKTDTNNKCQLKTGGDSVKANGVAAEQPLDFRTSGGKKKRKNKGKSRGKKAYQGVSKGDKVSTTSTESEGNSDHKVESFDNTEKFNSQQVKKSVISSVDVEDTAEDIPGEGTEVCEEDTRVKTEAQTTAKNQKLNSKQASDELNGIMLESGSISKVGDLKKIVEQNDSSIVKIVAGGPSGDDSDDEMEGNTTSTQASTEHVTKCAFQFSNCVIYDLDND